MTDFLIAEAFHGLMHFYKLLWKTDIRGMSIEVFIETNKANLNTVTQEFRRSHKLTAAQTTKSTLSMGIRRFLIGENVPIIDHPLQHTNHE